MSSLINSTNEKSRTYIRTYTACSIVLRYNPTASTNNCQYQNETEYQTILIRIITAETMATTKPDHCHTEKVYG
jgi:hypothetical protein